MAMTETVPETTSAPARKTVFFSLRWKLIFWFTLLFTLVFGIAFYWFFKFSERQALEKIQEDMVNTLVAGAEGVDGDMLLDLNANGEPNAAGFSDDERYLTLMGWLDTVHKIEPRAWPYLFIRGSSSREGIFLVDLQARYTPERSAKFKQSYVGERDVPGLGGLELSLENGVLASYTDDWGSWVSAYAPIKNSAGETIGAMGIDFEAGYVDYVRKSIMDSIVIAFVITYASIFAMVMLISAMLIRPIQKLTAQARRIGEGDYEQDLSQAQSAFTRDEIGVLAEVFKVMIDKVYQREQRLKMEVSKLRIEIDDAKRLRQVSEIVDTDFFRELQTKANDMRARRGKGQSSND